MKWRIALPMTLLISDRAWAQPPIVTSDAIDGLAAWETATRARVGAVFQAIPHIPAEALSAAARVRADALTHGHAPVFVIFAGLTLLGILGEEIYKRGRPARETALSRLMPAAIFSACVAVVFFAVEWPPLARVVLLIFLSALICYRIVSVLIAVSSPPRRVGRTRAWAAVVLLAIASTAVGRSLGVDPEVVRATAYLFSLVLLALAVEAVLAERLLTRAARAALIIVTIMIWLLWCVDLKGLFWLGVFAFMLPPLLRGVGHLAAESLPDGVDGTLSILVVRGARAVVIALATGWLALVWRLNPDALGHRDPVVTALFFGLLKSVIVILLADLLWQISKSWIARMLAGSSDNVGLSAEEVARRGRLRTLLPILRNALAVVVLVMTALVVLAELGVEIGPLLAGAGIFGVALGFGSQTLVKDVISGVFYMFDDAFRVGEYIQAKNYKGTVEGFSLRSVRLRHHRGPVFTVPFGDLGAVENMSRDWGVVKFRVAVDFKTDLEKARKLTKKIGQTLLDDPELGPLFIEPLKMKGLEEFGEYGLVLSFGMTLKPSPMQSFIRRRANLMLRDVFTENGIEFATPSVQVGGGDAGSGDAAAAAVALKARAPSAKAEA